MTLAPVGSLVDEQRRTGDGSSSGANSGSSESAATAGAGAGAGGARRDVATGRDGLGGGDRRGAGPGSAT